MKKTFWVRGPLMVALLAITACLMTSSVFAGQNADVTAREFDAETGHTIITTSEYTATIPERGAVIFPYDPLTGYSTIVTADYSAHIPREGKIIYPDSKKDTIREEVLDVTVFSDDEAIVPFDYRETFSEIYQNVVRTNPGIKDASAQKIAREITARIKAARDASLECNDEGAVYDASSGKYYIDLGRVEEGELLEPQPIGNYTGEKYNVVDDKQFH